MSAFSSPPSSGKGSKKISRPDEIPGFASLSLPGSGLEPAVATSHCRSLFHRGPAEVLSPLTNLALNMGNLAVLGRYSIPPRQRCGFHFAGSALLMFFVCMYVCVFNTATATPQRGLNIHRWKKSPHLLLTSHLILVSAHGFAIKTMFS